MKGFIALLLAVLCVMAITGSVSAQQPDSTWQLRDVQRSPWNSQHGGTFYNIVYYRYPLPDGGLVHAGMYTFDSTTTNAERGNWRDFWMAVTDRDGRVVWNHAYGDTGVQVAKFVELTYDFAGNHNGYIFMGYARPRQNKTGCMLAVSTDLCGNIRWAKTYPTEFWSSFRSSRRMSWDHYELFGSQQDADGLWHSVVMLIDHDGNELSRSVNDWGNK